MKTILEKFLCKIGLHAWLPTTTVFTVECQTCHKREAVI